MQVGEKGHTLIVLPSEVWGIVLVPECALRNRTSYPSSTSFFSRSSISSSCAFCSSDDVFSKAKLYASSSVPQHRLMASGYRSPANSYIGSRRMSTALATAISMDVDTDSKLSALTALIDLHCLCDFCDPCLIVVFLFNRRGPKQAP